MKTYRQVYTGHGSWSVNFNARDFQDNSVVLVTACEVMTLGNNPHHRFIGAARVWVSNIAPHGPPFDPNHGVSFVINAEWGSNINILVDITLLDSPVVFESP
jgi:hypothetical protein